jgi:putative ABC transport system permease protein
MAWRDSRKNRGRLALFISSIILGIAALVSTLSFGHNLRMGIDDEAKTLVGADLVVGAYKPLSKETLALVDSAPNRHSEERNFNSMILFEKNGQSRLVQVHALEGDYPFYGSLVTTPAAAGMSFRRGRQALVDKTLMLQYGGKVGDSVRIGNLSFMIAGSIDQAPGRNELSTTISPPVYIPLRWLADAGLMRTGSRVDYRYYYQYPRSDVRQLMSVITPRLEKKDSYYETVDSRKRKMSRGFGDLTQFLTLISFIALLLGCVGVGSSVNIYIREKIADVAVLRCLGLKARQAFLIYLIQVAGIGLLGSIAGAVLGVAIQQVLPVVLKDILPFETSFHISWPAVAEGVIVGLTISLLFALLPLLSIRKISPMYTLRASVEGTGRRRDALRWLVYLLIVGFITGFAFLRMRNWGKAMAFTAGLLVSFLFLAGMAKLLMFCVRRFFPARWGYLWRQGFANLYRPNNQTLILVVTIGLGTTFIGTLYFVQELLIDRVTVTANSNQGNMILFDIQREQLAGVDSLVRSAGLPVLQSVSVVTVRYTSIKGITADMAAKDTVNGGGRRGRRGVADTTGRPGWWLFEREQRVTYRDSLVPTEKLVAGKLGAPVKDTAGAGTSGGGTTGGGTVGGGGTIFVSVDEEYARLNLHVGIGDTIVFDVQGAPVTTVVGSLRAVNWRRLGPSFAIVFPTGVLEQAPQFRILITQVESPEESARFQQAMVRRFPTISMIDMRLVLSILNDVLGKIGFVIRFMAGFSLLTGVIVLIASVLISKFQRIQESVLLRTLGASRRQVRTIQLLEYFFLGALAAGTGILLALGLTFALSELALESGFSVHWASVAGIFVFVCVLTVLVGWYNSRGVLNRPPLEVLRNEA